MAEVDGLSFTTGDAKRRRRRSARRPRKCLQAPSRSRVSTAAGFAEAWPSLREMLTAKGERKDDNWC